MSAAQTEDRQTTEASEKEIRDLVDRGGKLHKEVGPLKKKEEELNLIKARLRELADGKDRTFSGKKHTAIVENKPDTICRAVAQEDSTWVVETCGPKLPFMFSLHPIKGTEQSFELNALKNMAKKTARALLDRLTVPATSWVRFS